MATLLALKVPRPDDTANKTRLFRDTSVEFLATAVFVWAGTMSAVSTGKQQQEEGIAVFGLARILPVAFVFGISIMSLAFSIGHLTGGHMNPAVSLTMYFKCKMSFTKMLCYWVAQFIGALVGAALTWGCCSGLANMEFQGALVGSPPYNLGSNGPQGDFVTVGNMFLIELMGSFMFFFVIAQTACDERGTATSLFPAIPIGFVLIVVHICLIPFTGCGVNPARTFGPSMITCMYGDESKCDAVAHTEWYWVYYIGPFLAAFFVAEVTLWMEWDVDEPTEKIENVETADSAAAEDAKA